MTKLSTYVSEARKRPVPDEVLEKAKWALLDTFAAIVSGSQLPAGRAAIRFVRAYGGKPVATVLGDLTLCGAIDAAMANGTMGHADETDDVLGGPWHPGCNVLPAALALGEQCAISGAHFLRAIVLGYDIGTRVMFASGVKMDFRNPTNSMGGVFGATAAAACAASLTAQQVRWALAYAAQQCSGIDDFRRDPMHIEKAFMNGGMGARSGVTSALLVLSGFDGVNDIMSGSVSFFGPYTETANPALLVDKLGEHYYISEAHFKRWPVGAPLQPLLDALRVLLKREPFEPGQVREILIRYAEPGTITDNAGSPDINVQHAVALMLVDKKLTFESIHDYARMKDPALVRLRSVTKLIPRPFNERAGASGAAAEQQLIQITLADGRRITQDSITTGIAGTASNPWTREWMVAKARDLMTPVLGAGRTEQLIDRVLKLEQTRNILELRPLLQPDSVSGQPRLSQWPMA
jgi:2-methylcitrate dehydratase PrpD